MEKQSRYYVLSGGNYGKGIYGVADNIAELNEIMTELADEHGESHMQNARILGVLHDTHVDGALPFKQMPGKIAHDEWEETDETEAEFVINEGDYRGKRFEYEEDVIDFLRGKIEEGKITADEASTLDILKQPVLSGGISFAQAPGEWVLDMDELTPAQEDLINAMGDTYIATRNVPKEARPERYSEEAVNDIIKKHLEQLHEEGRLVSLDKELDTYDDALLMQAEAINLMQRASVLMQESKRRTAGIVSVTSGDVAEE